VIVKYKFSIAFSCIFYTIHSVIGKALFCWDYFNQFWCIDQQEIV